MAHTYTSLFYHIVFSTKYRVRYIRPEIEQQVWEYMGGVMRQHKLTALQIGGIDDHIHALIMALPTFAWQEGYGAFTVSKSGLGAVVRYIQNQRTHHQKQSYQAEYLEFLRRHAVEYDERYVWG